MKYMGKVQQKFLPPKPKDCFKWCELVQTRCFHGAYHHGVCTTRSTPNEFEQEQTILVSMVRTRCSSKLVRTIEIQ